MMTPAGLALFYGGMSRYKNLLNTLAMTFVAYCLTSVVWVMWGYSLAFGPDNPSRDRKSRGERLEPGVHPQARHQPPARGARRA